jgi:uncharacterized protein YutE (UPF0331/DUF86 family)
MNSAFSDAVVQRKLAGLRVLLDDLAAATSATPAAPAAFEADRVRRYAIERILTLLVDSAVDINVHVVTARRGVPPATYRESFLAAGEVGLIDPTLARDLARAAGLRNILVHDYLEADANLIWQAVAVAPEQFAEYIRQVSGNLRRVQDHR